MNLKEILNRTSPSNYSIDEITFVVEKYIEKITKKTIKINIYKNINVNNLNNYDVSRLHNEHVMLFKAFNIAEKTLKNDYKNWNRLVNRKKINRRRARTDWRKKEVLGNDYVPESDQYTSSKKDAIIDFENQFIFVDTGENEVCVTRLLDSDYFPVDGTVHKMTDRQYFKGNLDEVYNILKNK